MSANSPSAAMHVRVGRLAVAVGNRTLFIVGGLFAVITLSFLLINLTPGDPARAIAGELASDQQVDAVRAALGLDQPIWLRYLEYLAGLARGDLGVSYYSGVPIADELAAKFPATLELIVLSVAVAATIGIGLGVLSSVSQGRAADRISRFVVGVLQAIPDFFLALLLIFVFFYLLSWAPAPTGNIGVLDLPPPHVTGSLVIDALLAGNPQTALSALKHMVLPVMTLGLIYAAYFAKTTRASMIQALESEPILVARAFGLRESTVTRYALAEGRTAILTYSGVIFAALFGGEAVVETIFAWNGIGRWALSGIMRLDLPVIQAMVLVAGAITLVVYTLLDLLVSRLDPRLRHGR